MSKIIFILGGARSGKSSYALKLAKESQKKKIAFIATAEALDSEMQKRILFHRKSRPSHWETFEAPRNVAILLEKIANKFDVIIIDCLTLFVCNLLIKKYTEKKILIEMENILAVLEKNKAKSIIISNEVGLGIVPNAKLGRDFRDVAGKVNQLVAQRANNVFFMVSGLPMRIK